MSIRTNIDAVITAVHNDPLMGDDLQRESIAAIKAGEGSDEWRIYMERFAKTEDQLARLLATDNTQNIYEFDVARTSLVGNGTCGNVTIDSLADGVDDKLDEGLSESRS